MWACNSLCNGTIHAERERDIERKAGGSREGREGGKDGAHTAQYGTLVAHGSQQSM